MNDPGYAAVIATCKVPPPPAGGGGRGAAPAAGAPGGNAPAGGGGGQRGPQGPRDYTVAEIPGVIAAGARWKFLWQEAGNNGDGILGTDDGSLLIAQNDNSKVVTLDRNGKPSIVYTDTRTGGSLSMNTKGALFIVMRGLRTGILQLAPQRRILANTYNGDPLDCVGGNPNDLTAASNGGVYFSGRGLWYASPAGVITKYGENANPNGIILSADERTLYITNAGTLTAFDVQPDGSLTNQRVFAMLQGGGDGLAIDSAGRIYVSGGSGVQVISAQGRHMGTIPTPRGAISVAFGGPDKKTLFVLARGAIDADGNPVGNAAQVYSISMIAQGYRGRAK
jgi:gluconolactonase